MSSLCSTCRDVDLEAAFAPQATERRDIPRFDLGSAYAILQRSSSCSFCELLRGKLEQQKPHDPQLRKDWEEQPCELKIRNFFWTFMGGNGYDNNWVEHLESESTHRQQDMPARGQNCAVVTLKERLVFSFTPIYDPSLPRAGQQLRVRRMRTNGIDTELIRSWMAICDQKHGDICEKPAWLFPLPPSDLRLIQVNSRAVVFAPPNPVYAALSYIWGGDQFTVNATGMSNLPFRLPEPPLLSQTIFDALFLCSRLGVPYLWVDALCITQEPAINDDKSFHLQQMDRIYRSAYVTICAASTCSANQGLSELYAREHSQKVFSFKQREYATISPSLMDMVEDTPWNSRGWTFQERLLSRRAIVITKEQAFWICQADDWSESVVAEPFVEHMRTQIIFSSDCTAEPIKREYGLSQSHVGDLFGTGAATPNNMLIESIYNNLCSTYNRRVLGHASDGVYAIQGVLNVLLEQEDFLAKHSLQGLLVELLDLTLLWTPWSGINRDPETIARGTIPSWTWAGWFGNEWSMARVDDSNLSSYGVDKTSRSVRWYILDDDGNSSPLSTRKQNHAHVCGLPSEADPTKPPPVQQQMIHTNGYYLHFLTTVSKFELGNRLQWRDLETQDIKTLAESQNREYRPAYPYEIMDQSGVIVGHVVLAEHEADAVAVRRADFIFLSYGREFDRIIDASTLKEEQRRNWEADASPVVNCMIVRGDVENGVVERWALGKVHKAAWLSTNPRSRWVVLG